MSQGSRPKHIMQQGIAVSQKMLASIQMRQALSILQAPLQEVELLIDQELQQNPLIEIEDQNYVSDELGDEISEPIETGDPEEIDFSEHKAEILDGINQEFDEFYRLCESQTKENLSKSEQDDLELFKRESRSSEISSRQSLAQQFLEICEDPILQEVAQLLFGYMDDQGFINHELDEICLLESIDRAKAEKALGLIKQLEPLGVGCKNLQEALLLQLTRIKGKNSLAYRIIESFYDEMLNNRLPYIAKKTKSQVKDVKLAVTETISKLNFSFLDSKVVTQQIIPDLYIEQYKGTLHIRINNEDLPKLKVNQDYLALLKQQESSETRQYMKEKLGSLKSLLKGLDQRGDTLLKLGQCLIKKQKSYFESKNGELKPMTLKEVADFVGVHESTIGRAVQSKYVDSPRGIIPLKSLFSSKLIKNNSEEISSKSIQDKISELIQQEDKEKPLSDDAIASQLKNQGIKCARRTVAKYRSILKLGNAAQRKAHLSK